MKLFVNFRISGWFGAMSAVCCLALGFSPASQAQEYTAATLIDRQHVQDLITHYYYNFGRENPENFSDFYADDAELILGDKHYKGKDGIMDAYGRGPNSKPRPARQRYTFNVTISNPLITVHGTTATSQVIFTEYEQEKQGDPTKMTTQGREYSTFVKVKGQWRYLTRQIMGGNEPPAGWKE